MFQFLVSFACTVRCVVQVIRHVEAGKTLDSPPGCPDCVYQLMLGCWRRQPQERASIKDLRHSLDLLDEPTSSLILLDTTDTQHRQPDKQAVAIDDARLQQYPQPMTTTPNVPYLEIIA